MLGEANGYGNQGRMKRRLVDDAEREWGSQKDRGRWRQAPEGSTAWLLEEGVSGMGQRKVAGIWKRMKSQRGKLGDEGLEVVVTMVECTGAVEDPAESCKEGLVKECRPARVQRMRR